MNVNIISFIALLITYVYQIWDVCVKNVVTITQQNNQKSGFGFWNFKNHDHQMKNITKLIFSNNQAEINRFAILKCFLFHISIKFLFIPFKSHFAQKNLYQCEISHGSELFILFVYHAWQVSRSANTVIVKMKVFALAAGELNFNINMVF